MSHDSWLQKQADAHYDCSGPTAEVTLLIERDDVELTAVVLVEDGGVSSATVAGVEVELTRAEKDEAVERAGEAEDDERQADAESRAE